MDDAVFYDASAPSSLLKRKCEPDRGGGDDVAELFHDICLSPRNKKSRLDFSSTSSSTNSPNLCLPPGTTYLSTSDLDLSEEFPSASSFGESDDKISELPSKPWETEINEERAIVLYKPVTPPLFPGGPTSGYQIVVDADIFSSAGKVNSPNWHNARKADFWLQSLDNSTNKSELVSDQMDDDEDDVPVQSGFDKNNSLAVVPWVSKSPPFMPPVEVPSEPKQVSMEGEKEVDGTMEVDSMEMGEGQVSNSLKDRINEPWQQYRVPQPHYIYPMWSH